MRAASTLEQPFVVMRCVATMSEAYMSDSFTAIAACELETSILRSMQVAPSCLARFSMSSPVDLYRNWESWAFPCSSSSMPQFSTSGKVPFLITFCVTRERAEQPL